MNPVKQRLNYLTMLLEVLISFFFVCILLLTITLVVLRYGFNSSIIGANEAMNYLFIYTTALGAAVSLGKKTHISISFFVDMLPAKINRIVSIVNYLLIGLFNSVLTMYSIKWIRATGGFESPVMRIPQWMVQISIPLGCILATIYCLNNMIILIAEYDNCTATG